MLSFVNCHKAKVARGLESQAKSPMYKLLVELEQSQTRENESENKFSFVYITICYLPETFIGQNYLLRHI